MKASIPRQILIAIVGIAAVLLVTSIPTFVAYTHRPLFHNRFLRHPEATFPRWQRVPPPFINDASELVLVDEKMNMLVVISDIGDSYTLVCDEFRASVEIPAGRADRTINIRPISNSIIIYTLNRPPVIHQLGPGEASAQFYEFRTTMQSIAQLHQNR